MGVSVSVSVSVCVCVLACIFDLSLCLFVGVLVGKLFSLWSIATIEKTFRSRDFGLNDEAATFLKYSEAGYHAGAGVSQFTPTSPDAPGHRISHACIVVKP